MVSIKKILLGSVLSTALLSTLSLQAASADEVDADPWEGFNRAVFTFNDTLDRYALKPLAQGYQAVTPDFVETGVGNFFGNLSDVGSIANNLLQGKGDAAGQDLARVVFNSTIGLAGLIDVATPMGLPEHDEDFGQTLGYWGLSSGPYLVLPLLGPSSVRDGIGLIPDSLLDPVGEVDHVRTRNALYATRIIDTRAELLAAEHLLNGDRYSAMRDAYLQRRAFLVNDGEVKANFDDDQF